MTRPGVWHPPSIQRSWGIVRGRKEGLSGGDPSWWLGRDRGRADAAALVFGCYHRSGEGGNYVGIVGLVSGSGLRRTRKSAACTP